MDKIIIVVSGSFEETFVPLSHPEKLRKLFNKTYHAALPDNKTEGKSDQNHVQNALNDSTAEEQRLRLLLPGDTMGEESALEDGFDEMDWMEANATENTCTDVDDFPMPESLNQPPRWQFAGTAVARCDCNMLILPREVLRGVLQMKPDLKRQLHAFARSVRKVRSWEGLQRVWTLNGCERGDLHRIAEHAEVCPQWMNNEQLAPLKLSDIAA